MISEVYNEDCMIGMAKYPDKYFDLAIVDPPYGRKILKKNKYQRHDSKSSSYRNETIPDSDYYKELQRVSKNQIIWGFQYQYHMLPANGSCIIWDKEAEPELHNMSSCDIAWTSLKIRIERIRLHWCGAVKCESEKTIHIHQKPVKLYKWLLRKFAKPGMKIIDTHLGSGSSRIACWDFGCDFYGWEIDKENYDNQEERFQGYKQQLVMSF